MLIFKKQFCLILGLQYQYYGNVTISRNIFQTYQKSSFLSDFFLQAGVGFVTKLI